MTASPELEHLNAFVGIWETEGEMTVDPSGERVKFKATDTYEWLPGRYFLFHRFEGNLPGGNVVRIEVIGYNREINAYTMHAFDSQGNAFVMEGSLEMDNWTFVGERTLFSGGFRDSGKVFAGLWERRPGEGADWQPWMEVLLKKVV